MTVLVTGGAGFIGANVAHRCAELGEDVRILDDLSRPGVERNVKWLEQIHRARVEVVVGDVRDPAAVARAVAGVEHVFHFAAQVAVTTSIVSPRADFDVNAGGTLNLLEAIRSQDEPPSILFTSTNKVYGPLDDVGLALRGSRYEPEDPELARRGMSEERPLSFHSPYGCSKGAADQYVVDWARTFGLRACVFRMSCIYGPRQLGTEDQGWVAHFLIKAMRGETISIYGDGKLVRDVLLVDELVDAMFRVRKDIGRLAGQAFNVGGGPGSTISLLELVERIEHVTRRKPRVDFDEWRLADQRWYVSDTRRLERATGWRPLVDPMTGVKRLHDWLQQNADRSRPLEAAP